MILTKSFFNREADIVARELIGCDLCIEKGNRVERHIIYETEAYMGPHDLACHASKGRTKRTEVLYQEAGTIYVYLIYGMYDMLNFVTREKGYPAAVLIRGAGVYDGPGKLTKRTGINRDLNGKTAGKGTGLWIECGDEREIEIMTTPRIGIGYAKEWQDAPLRFLARK